MSYDYEQWDKGQTIRELRYWLRCRDARARDRYTPGIEAIMLMLDRLDCWHAALENLIIDPDESLGAGLLWFWRARASHIGQSLKGDLIPVVDTLKCLLPPYGGPGLTLYRGQLDALHQQRVYGISWTSDLSVAKVFAISSPDEGDRVVLKIDASSEMIVAACVEHPSPLREEEYIIDPRLIRSVSIVH